MSATATDAEPQKRAGRPARLEASERRERFENLICNGWHPADAARTIGISDGRALRILADMIGLGRKLEAVG